MAVALGMSCSILADHLALTVKNIKAGHHISLETRASSVRSALWADLTDRGATLLVSIVGILKQPASVGMRWCLTMGRSVLTSCMAHLTALCDAVGSGGNDPCPQEHNLRMAFGVPGVLGCMDMKGERILWNPLVHPLTGLRVAFDKLQLDVAGLPAARLPTGTTLPRGCGWLGECRGGPSYESCAVVWNPELSCVVRTDIGNDTRIWLEVQGGHEVLLVCTLAFPTAGAHHEEAWLSMLSGLHDDLCCIKSLQGLASLRRMILQGDFNFQPSCLGGGDDHSSRRRRAWERFVAEWGLILRNEPLDVQDVMEVVLPLRKRSVKLMRGSTRHGPSVGRSIDLVMSTCDVVLNATIHNGLQCDGLVDVDGAHVASSDNECNCAWDHCLEYANGDHFLIEMDVDFPILKARVHKCLLFPAAWHDGDRWSRGLEAATKPLGALSEWLLAVVGRDSCLQQCSRTCQHWVGEFD